MSFHLMGYTASATTAADTDLTPIQDDIMVIQNGHFLPQTPRYALWSAAMGATLNWSRIVTPTLRQISSPYVRPIILGAEPLDMSRVADYRKAPVLLQALEEIQSHVYQTSGSGEQETTLLATAQSPQLIVPSGQVMVMQGTSTTTTVAHGWTTIATTWQDSLPNGQYACVGLEYVAATAQAARLIFQGQTDRPGCLGSVLLGNRPDPMFQGDGLGTWGNFTTTAMPTVQLLNFAAVSSHTVYLYYVRTG